MSQKRAGMSLAHDLLPERVAHYMGVMVRRDFLLRNDPGGDARRITC